MGASNTTALKAIQAVQPSIKDVGLFPAAVNGREDSLFVNAWDPHSMPGNGNCRDASLDGYVGRHSNVAAAGWPLSNVYLPASVGM